MPADGQQLELPGDGQQLELPGDGQQLELPGDGQQLELPGDFQSPSAAVVGKCAHSAHFLSRMALRSWWLGLGLEELPTCTVSTSRFVDRDMMMRFLGWGIGHLNQADFPHEAEALIASDQDHQLQESEENDLEDDWEGHEGREVEVGDEGLDSELETVALFEY
ncbi:hypothetical protein C8Q72DRAFT_951809 [Fomitopsis betulina]|nr:hypothetical protein C8Q72DRAFT_951809 [Fomitopsis betulina]